MTEIIALDEASWATAAWPLGMHPHAEGVTFAVYAPAATRIQLEVYPEALGATASHTFLLARGTDDIWRARLQGLQLGALIGYRVWGPNWEFDEAWVPGSDAGFIADLDEHGNRFNPNKVLFDPYAREITHNVYTDELHRFGVNDGVFGTGGEEIDGTPRRLIDTALFAPKGVVIACATRVTPKPNLPAKDAIIYEASIEQLTGHPSVARLADILSGESGFEGVVDIPAEYQGTYKGAGLLAPYLKALGITTVELLPVHETNVSESGRDSATNSWGYMTLAFFAPNRRYAADKSWGGPTREFKEMVSAFHEAGMEVYLDVVYNHTAEGGNWNGDVNTTGFTSLGGFATAEYYQMTSGNILVDGATGTSNQLNYSSAAAQQLVLDSLHYWSRDMHVDGFRFDLATVLGRQPGHAERDDWGNQKRFFTEHPLLVEIARLAEEDQVEVIAEAWDLWGYEVGNFPRGWGEWNGRYRDAVRNYTKGEGNVSEFIDMFNGDYHHFHDNGGPQKTINFVVAHDGFNLADLVSYQTKLNDQPYPFGPSDGGSDNNLSWDSGGDHALRRQRLRNLWTILMFSRGVPMIVAGDEFGRTQNGNNNPWALHSVAMRNNYAMIATNTPQRIPVAEGIDAAYHDNLGEFNNETPNVNGLFRFATNLMHLRHRHNCLQQTEWGDFAANNSDVSYLFYNPGGTIQPQEGDRALGVYIDSPEENFWIMINMTGQPVDFYLPAEFRVTDHTSDWRYILDTATWAELVNNYWPKDERVTVHAHNSVHPWSIAVWHRKR